MVQCNIDLLKKYIEEVKPDQAKKMLEECKFSVSELNEAEDVLQGIFYNYVEGYDEDYKDVLKIIYYLVIHGADPNYECCDVYLISYAAEHGSYKVTSALLSLGANPNVKDYYGFYPIGYAVCSKTSRLFNLLIKYGADVNVNNGEEGNTVLMLAVGCKNIDAIKTLIGLNVDMNKKNYEGETALHVAVDTGSVDIARILINAGADVNAKDNWGRTPLHIAVEKRNMDLVKLLVYHGANINAKDNYGITPLHYAVIKNDKDIAEFLILNGANINAKNNNGDAPLHLAAKFGNYNIAKLLVDHNADVNVRDNVGDTPLHLAVMYDYIYIVKLLLDHGANVNIKNDTGFTPLHIAVYFGFYDIVKLLLDHGADVNVRDNVGDTPLFYAVNYRKLDIAKLLLDHGADPYIKNNKGKTVFDIAKERGYRDMLNLLSSYSRQKYFDIISASYRNHIVSITLQINEFPIELSITDYDIAPRLLFGGINYSTEPPTSVNEVLASGLYNEKGESVDNIQIFVPGKKIKLEFYLTDTSPPYDEPAVLVIPYKKIGEDEIRYTVIYDVIIKGLTKTK